MYRNHPWDLKCVFTDKWSLLKVYCIQKMVDDRNPDAVCTDRWDYVAGFNGTNCTSAFFVCNMFVHWQLERRGRPRYCAARAPHSSAYSVLYWDLIMLLLLLMITTHTSTPGIPLSRASPPSFYISTCVRI